MSYFPSTQLPILSIQPSSLFNSITNRRSYIPAHIAVMSKNGSIIWRLRWNATLSGGEVIGMGFAVSGGTTDETMDHRDVRDRFKYQTRRLMRDPFDPTTVYDTLTITAEKVNTGSTDVYATVVVDRT